MGMFDAVWAWLTPPSMIRAFSMNSEVGGSSPPPVETFSDSKTLTFSQEHPVRVSKIIAVVRAQLTFQMLTLLKNIIFLSDI